MFAKVSLSSGQGQMHTLQRRWMAATEGRAARQCGSLGPAKREEARNSQRPQRRHNGTDTVAGCVVFDAVLYAFSEDDDQGW